MTVPTRGAVDELKAAPINGCRQQPQMIDRTRPGFLSMPSTLNGLLKQGATIVTEAADELSVIRPILGQQIEQPVEESDGGAPRLGEPAIDERARITSLLGPAPVSIDDLVRLSQSSPAIVRTALLDLEIAGRLERHRGMVSLL
jgi:DNA processing protein